MRDSIFSANCGGIVQRFWRVTVGNDLHDHQIPKFAPHIEEHTKMLSLGNILKAACNVEPMSFSDL